MIHEAALGSVRSLNRLLGKPPVKRELRGNLDDLSDEKTFEGWAGFTGGMISNEGAADRQYFNTVSTVTNDK